MTTYPTKKHTNIVQLNAQRMHQKGVTALVIPVIILLVIAGLVFVFRQKGFNPISTSKEEQAKSSNKKDLWTEAGVVIPGAFADADIVDLASGKFRMYYSAEPETPGFQGQVYSAVSSDGINWSKEDGTRLTSAIFPSVIKLVNGGYRMYFQNQQAIKSALSSDGLSWEGEEGMRVDTANSAGLTLSGVVAPTVIKTKDEYIMVYGGVIDQAYSKEKVPNKDTHLLLWATSKDGLNFENKGIALDSKNETFKGWQDGPELVEWDDGTIRLYFWSYKGIYHITYKDGNFSKEAVFDYSTSKDPLIQFPENPPGDPTLAKINGKWFMYYGQHGKGIYYATQ